MAVARLSQDGGNAWADKARRASLDRAAAGPGGSKPAALIPPRSPQKLPQHRDR